MSADFKDTIVAIATPPGRGGIAVIRVSGPKVQAIARHLLTQLPPPRYALFTPFLNADGTMIDEGLALFFPHPHSFTGEDVLEIQGHGGPVVQDLLLQRIVECGARLAQPGEFSQRAFLNDKLDLAQAEAIADLIDAASVQAAQSAVRSLQGQFSQRIHQLVSQLMTLRMHVEAAIDFPEEEIDFLAETAYADQLQKVMYQLDAVKKAAFQGTLLREGITLAIAGKPNAGKSSLLNALSGRNTAIVTDIPGTTRDIIREYIHLAGIPLHILDTAGLRHSDDPVEQEGIRRALEEINQADFILLVTDAAQTAVATSWRSLWPAEIPLPTAKNILIIRNKIDLVEEPAAIHRTPEQTEIALSAKTGAGIDLLQQELTQRLNIVQQAGESTFTARRRHLEALDCAARHLDIAETHLQHRAGELVAEELRLAQQALGEITGEVRADDLLGKIFSSFCIGK